jgi:hypothetical protein
MRVDGNCDGSSGNIRFNFIDQSTDPTSSIKVWLDDAATGLTVADFIAAEERATTFEAADRVIVQWVESSQLVTLTLTGQGDGTNCFYNAQAVIGNY